MSEQWDALGAVPHPNDVAGYWEGVTSMAWDELDKNKSLSRNDFFAGMALNALMSRGVFDDAAAQRAWKVADLMVKHRK